MAQVGIDTSWYKNFKISVYPAFLAGKDDYIFKKHPSEL